MHSIKLTSIPPLNEKAEGQIGEIIVIVPHINALAAVHKRPEHPKGRGKFLYTCVHLTNGTIFRVTETPQQITGIIGGH